MINRGRGCVLILRWAVAAALGCCAVTAGAQVAPGPPTLPSATQPLVPGQTTSVIPGSSSLLSVPTKADRSESTDAIKYRLSGLKLEGAHDHPKSGLTTASLQKILDAAVAAQPAAGYTLAEWEAAAAQKISDAYHNAGFPLAVAFFPVQSTSEGRLVVQVLEGRLWGVRVENNKHYSKETIEQPFLDQRGGAFNQSAIESRLQRVNDYPGLQVFGVVAPGEHPGDTDLILRVKEKPFDFSIGADNWGAPSAGEYRAHAGFAWNDPLGFGDRLQALVLKARAIHPSTSDKTEGADTLFYNVDYRLPFAGGRVAADVGFARNSYTPGGFGGATGIAKVGDVGLDVLLMRTRLTRVDAFLKGYDRTANFDFGGGIGGQEERLHDGQLGVSFSRLDRGGIWTGSVAITHGKNSVDVNPIRLGSATSYTLGTIEAERLQRVTNSILIRLHVAGQQSSSPLPTLDQISLTGPTAVRAYEVGHFPADTGYYGTGELIIGAPFFASKVGPGGRPWGEALQLIAFYDQGHGTTHATLNPPPLTGVAFAEQSETLKGWGIGIGVTWPKLFTFRLDAARPLAPTPLDFKISGPAYKATRYYASLNLVF